jgi:hypothetical protein
VVGDFPWPVTDDELILNNALAIVMNTLEVQGSQRSNEDAVVRNAAASQIVEAYSKGIRDPDILAHHALKALRDARRRTPGG